MTKDQIKAPKGKQLHWFDTKKDGLPVRSGIYGIKSQYGEYYYAHFNVKKQQWGAGVGDPIDVSPGDYVSANERLAWAGLIK